VIVWCQALKPSSVPCRVTALDAGWLISI